MAIMSGKSHKVHSHHWYDGVLHTTEDFFDSLFEAMDFIKRSEADHVKLYDHNEDLVHSTSPKALQPQGQQSTYA
jgi:hypothetical protein